jgi:FKBP-type peptidyl-prolyl cis-trans isomerase
MKIFNTLILLVVAISVSSCFKTETDYEKRVKMDSEAIEAYLRENNEDADKSMSGVYYKPIDTNPFGQTIAEYSIVSVIYSMRTLSGVLIEEHDDIYEPVKFSYSENGIMPVGMYDIGRMRLGETFRFYIPSYLAFSNYSLEGVFGPHTNFIMDITLVDIFDEEIQNDDEVFQIENYLYDHGITTAQKLPSGMYYIENVEGTGESPKSNGTVKIHFTRSYINGDSISSTLNGQPLIVGLGLQNLIPGLEEGIKLMKKGGKATIIVPSRIGFGKSVQVIPLVVREAWVKEKMLSPATLPYSVLVHEVELLDMI